MSNMYYLMHHIGNIYHLVLYIQFLLQLLLSKVDDERIYTQYKLIYWDNHTIKPELVLMP